MNAVAALDAAASVPTPEGWRGLGELCCGDCVFCGDGLPSPVTWVEDLPAGTVDTYELRLCDGSVVACGSAQPWLVESGGEVELLTAAEIAASLRGGQAPRHALALPAPLEHRYSELDPEPYEVGARLGSGLLEEARGIPGRYLLGDVEQRRELLMGLLDEGGGVAPAGSVHFDTVHQHLATDVCELVRSLGYRATLSTGGGSRGGYKRVGFRTSSDVVFGLRAPAEQLRESSQADGANRRWVVDASEVGSRRMIALHLQADNHLFVVGDGLVVAPDAEFADPLLLQIAGAAVPSQHQQ